MSAEETTVFYATGRRKTSTARVFLVPGTGKMTINGQPYDKYLSRPSSRATIQQPFNVVSGNEKYDCSITVRGGGESGQAGAIRHAISRALVICDTELRPALKKVGYLTRDPRMVERKKYGLHGARRRSQFSKR